MNFRFLVLLLSTSLLQALPAGCQIAFVQKQKAFSPLNKYNDCCNPEESSYKTVPANLQSLEVLQLSKEVSVLIGNPQADFSIVGKKIEDFQKKFLTKAREIAKKLGVYVLLEDDHCIYLDPSCDLTPEVVAALNKEFTAKQL
jgi:hypothetical protein